MNKKGQIIVIEDDPDDIEIISTAVRALELPNSIIVFDNSTGVVAHLLQPEVDPMLVISDINLPRQHGLDLYRELITRDEFVSKDVPYVFLSTSDDFVKPATTLSKCGYFVKPRNYADYVNMIQRIVLYWNTVAYRISDI